VRRLLLLVPLGFVLLGFFFWFLFVFWVLVVSRHLSECPSSPFEFLVWEVLSNLSPYLKCGIRLVVHLVYVCLRWQEEMFFRIMVQPCPSLAVCCQHPELLRQECCCRSMSMPSPFSFYLWTCCRWVCLIHSWTCCCYLLPTASCGSKFQKSATRYVNMFLICLKLVFYHFQVPHSDQVWLLVIVHLFSHPPCFVNHGLVPFQTSDLQTEDF